MVHVDLAASDSPMVMRDKVQRVYVTYSLTSGGGGDLGTVMMSVLSQVQLLSGRGVSILEKPIH